MVTNVVYLYDNCLMMKKDLPKRGAKYFKENEMISKVKDSYQTIELARKLPIALADFTYSRFKKVAVKVPFTQSDWANILHLSERTLQRYAKENKSFEGIYVDRILQVEKLIDTGLDTFKSADAFYNWLKKPKKNVDTTISFESLFHSEGIQDVLNQLGRIQHGVYT